MTRVLKINQVACLGCGTCTALCPGVFSLNSDGKANVLDQHAAGEEDIKSAIDACPVSVIALTEE